MLRVGLTGELGSGKSTVARLLASRGVHVMSSDAMGRALMEPGQTVYQAVVDHFGPEVVLPDGHLDRPALARLAFDPSHSRVEELNAIVHPAVLDAQEREVAALAQAQPEAIVVIESALIFITQHAGEQPWRRRFDRIVLVTAPDELKVQRFVARANRPEAERAALERDALARLHAQRIAPSEVLNCLVIRNDGTEADLARRTEEVFQELQAAAGKSRLPEQNLRRLPLS